MRALVEKFIAPYRTTYEYAGLLGNIRVNTDVRYSDPVWQNISPSKGTDTIEIGNSPLQHSYGGSHYRKDERNKSSQELSISSINPGAINIYCLLGFGKSAEAHTSLQQSAGQTARALLHCHVIVAWIKKILYQIKRHKWWVGT